MAAFARIRTHAKVNLFLSVLGRRADGYHEVETILHGVRLPDDIEFVERDDGEITVEMTLEGLRGDVPPPEENLAYRAAKSIGERAGGGRGVAIAIRKRIPIGGGLGGGSGNAAGTLVTLAHGWGLDLERRELVQAASELGSDVPYCISGGTALATSRGEDLTRLPSPESICFVLGLSDEPLSTRAVYEEWDNAPTASAQTSSPMVMALGAGDVREVGALLHNDLEEPGFSLRPELRKKKEILLDAGGVGAGMSGSGPTMFCIAEDRASARTIAEKVEGEFDAVKVVRSQSVCIERLED